MKEIQNLFNEIGRSDVTADMDELLSSGIIDSMDIMALVSAIEKLCRKPVNADFIESESFKNFSTIAQLVQKVKNQ